MMLSESDLYNSNTEPNNNVNPKSLGAMWINYSNGRHYICSNNTMNNNTWLDPIGVLTNEFNSNINNLTNDTNNRINTINSNINNLTNDTNNRINSINSNIENLTNDTNHRINSNKSDINVTNSRIDNINSENNNKINTINRKINEINTRIDNINPGGLGYNQEWYLNNLQEGVWADPPYIKRFSNVWYQNLTSAPIALVITGPLQQNSDVALFIVPPNRFRDFPDANKITVSKPIHGGHMSAIGTPTVFGIVPPTFFYKAVFSYTGLYWSELLGLN